MTKPLHILILEDNATDAELNLRELRRAGFDPQWRRVETEADYLAALDPPPDLILADYSLPTFDGLRALKLLRERRLDIPFLLVSGMTGEETAVEAMKQGATDYLLKDRIARLGAAVERALEEKRLRAEKRRTDAALRESEERHRSLFDGSLDAIFSLGPDGRFATANPAARRLTGRTMEELQAIHFLDLCAPDQRAAAADAFRAAFCRQCLTIETAVIAGDGTRRDLFISGAPTLVGGEVVGVSCIARDITGRKQGDAAVRESHRRVTDILASITDGFHVIDAQWCFTEFNPAARRMFAAGGMDADAMLGKHIVEEAFPDARELPAIKALTRTMTERVATDAEVFYEPWQRWFSVRYFPTPDGGAATFFQDITEEKRADAVLRESGERLRLAMDAAEIGSWDWDMRTNEIIWSPEHEIIFGYEPGTPRRTFADFEKCIHPEDTRRVEAATQAAMEKRTDFFCEFRVVWPDGSVHWVSGFGRFHFDPEGRPCRMVGMIKEITGRKRTEEALRESGERLRLAVGGANLGTWHWDIRTGGLVWSERCLAMFGIPPGTEMSYAQFLAALHPDDRARTDAGVQRALREHSDYDVEMRSLWPDGSMHWVISKGRGYYDDAGQPVRMEGMALDITGRKQAEEQIRLLNQELESRVVERTAELRVAVAALEQEMTERRRLEHEVLEIGEREQSRLGQDLHDDLGQQLAGIEMFAHTLHAGLEAETHPSSADAAHLVACLNAALQTTRSLAKSFFPVELERGGLVLALEDLAHRTELLAKIRCQVAADAGFWLEKESAIHLYRIVQEAIGNALKHAKAGYIAIECRVGDDGARTVRVCDDGVGFKAPEKAGQWNGIGLHLLQYRARLMGAEVSVQTMPDGTGCQVTCRFAPPPATPLL